MAQVRLCPSILNANRDDLENEIQKVAKASDLLHLDIMDGIFVPNTTFSWDESLRIIDSSPLPVDAHLMVSNPDEIAPRFAQAGCKSVTFHIEAALDADGIIASIKSHGSRVGVAIKPGTPLTAVHNLLPQIDMLLVMTVEPGFGGQTFMVEMMPKVSSARAAIAELPEPHPWLQVDGGISLATIVTAARAGADTFVAGSAVYRSEEPATVLNHMRDLVLALE